MDKPGKQFVTEQEVRLSLGKLVASGGEGTVFEIRGDKLHVAKIYHSVPDEERIQKLRAMVVKDSSSVSKVSAWPVAVLSASHIGEVAGFTMPRLSGFSELHVLNTPRSRMVSFPEADWGFLI